MSTENYFATTLRNLVNELLVDAYYINIIQVKIFIVVHYW